MLHGPDRGTTVQILDSANVTDVAEASDGAGWAIGGRKLYRQTPDGAVSLVLNIRKYQLSDPDPVDQDGFAEESNPYGLTAIGTDALVTDAANNDLLRVTPDGDTTTVARFDLEEISTDHLPPGDGFPPTLTAEAVPTSVTIGPDGAAYVGELKGFPFRLRSSHVWRVDPNADGAFCSVRTPEPDCTVYAQGFTAIHDIAFNLHTGALYVYELAAKGVLAYEKGFETGNFPPAVLIEAKNGSRTRLAVGQLSEPGGVAVAPDGACSSRTGCSATVGSSGSGDRPEAVEGNRVRRATSLTASSGPTPNVSAIGTASVELLYGGAVVAKPEGGRAEAPAPRDRDVDRAPMATSSAG